MAAVLRTVATGPAIALGHSLGGYVAVLLAASEPKLINQLMVVDTATGLHEATVRAQIAASSKRLTMAFPSLEAYFDYWRQVPFILWTEPFERYLRADVEQRADGTLATRTLPTSVEEDLLYYFQPGQAARFADAARRVQAPATVFWAPVGLLDPQQPLMSLEGVEDLVHLLPRGRLWPIEGTNHYTILVAPEAVERIIGGLRADASPVLAPSATANS
jgi:pimeloyl-ACP methyl ester carboxylesterase